jgi:hypothetical protein
MNHSRTYRLTAGLMAGVFSLFTFGIPVVIASCPMPKGGNNMCAQCLRQETPGTEGLAKPLDASCCATVILATGNTTEFQHTNPFVPADVVLTYSITVRPAAVDVPLTSPGTASPLLPLLDDIPIRCSALLI